MLEPVIELFIFLAFLAFAAKRLMTYLHALQQDDYDNIRLLRWIIEHQVFDKKLSAALLLCGLLSFSTLVPFFMLSFLLFFAFGAIAYFEKDPRKISKKKLVLTTRAKRILFLALGIAGFMGLGSFAMSSLFYWIILVQLIPTFLILANLLLYPYEKAVQKKFYDEAHKKLQNINPTVIGVTGSFGKTSVKHILGHILKNTAPTLVTPGSINTLMGITRIIREQLEPNCKYFVVEMGAYGPGSIEKLCKLTPPDSGIITAIGHAHYERFKTLETVAHAKYELAQAVLQKRGTVIVNEKTLDFAFTGALYENHQESFIVCGGPDVRDSSVLTQQDVEIKLIEQIKDGLIVSLDWKGKNYILEAPLYGLHHGHNIALSFAAAVSLGLSPEDIEIALKTTPQIQHRLEVKKQPDGGALIDDAFNSNPDGFRAALDLMPILKDTGRSILITPGMVELGPAHDEAHLKLGAKAAEKCDIVIIVNPERIPTFASGFLSKETGKPLLKFATFKEAEDWLIKNRQDGDVVLLENDLPDLYEQVPNL